MKVLVLNGSPKEQSDTFRMTERFLKGLNAAGEHEVTVVNVIEKAIAPCKGCFGCWQQGEGHCLIGDDQNGILDPGRYHETGSGRHSECSQFTDAGLLRSDAYLYRQLYPFFRGDPASGRV